MFFCLLLNHEFQTLPNKCRECVFKWLHPKEKCVDQLPVLRFLFSKSSSQNEKLFLQFKTSPSCLYMQLGKFIHKNSFKEEKLIKYYLL